MRKDFWIRLTAGGLYCEPGDFFIDPWCPVERALITHAHSDHVRKGCKSYFTAEQNILLLRHRLGSASIEGLPWGVRKNVNGVEVSFHPSGHIRGAAQIRLAYRGEVCVITGDYKRHPDPTTTCFEPLRAHVLISESTFGLPMYRWSEPVHVIEEIGRWWATCRAEGKNAILFVYSLGKAQRLLATLPPIGPVYVYDSIAAVNQLYEREGVSLLPWQPLSKWWNKKEKGILLLAPPAARRCKWLSELAPYEQGRPSGWMALPKHQTLFSEERGFVLSDHADFFQLVQTIEESGAEMVIFMHGYAEAMTQFARKKGYEAYAWNKQNARKMDTQ